jgi:hypothetical protein
MAPFHRSAPVTLLVVTGLLLLPTGCATGSGTAEEGTAPTREGGEFAIWDYMETYLPREAYLAKFEIVPELGVTLLYPTREEDPRQVGPGLHRLPRAPTAFVHAQRERYVSQITGLLNQAPPRITSVTILAVISDRPLNLDPFLRAPSGVRDALGPRAYVNEILAVEQILGTVTGNPGPGRVEHRIQRVTIPSPWTIRR